jgi:hypothetical protein
MYVVQGMRVCAFVRPMGCCFVCSTVKRKQERSFQLSRSQSSLFEIYEIVRDSVRTSVRKVRTDSSGVVGQ